MKPDNKTEWIQLTISILGFVTAAITLWATIGGR